MSSDLTGDYALDCVRVAARPEKPRAYGLTIAADRGFGPNATDDLLLTAGEFIDIAKFAMGVSRLMPASVVRERVGKYSALGIPVFFAGEVTELAAMQGVSEQYFAQVKALGAWAVEISNAQIALGIPEKAELITTAKKAGLEVIAECGRKGGIEWGSSSSLVSREIEACLEAGAARVLIQAEGLNEGVSEVNTQLIEDLIGRFGLNALIFQAKTSTLITWFLSSFGIRVNLDVDAHQVLDLEAQRRGIRKRGVFGLVHDN